MKRTLTYTISILIYAFVLSTSIAQGQTRSATMNQVSRNEVQTAELDLTNLLAQARPNRRVGFSLMPESRESATSRLSFSIMPMAVATNLTVAGAGTVGRLTKWTGFTSSNSSIGDTTIFEDKSGNVGVGTETPTSKLTVTGMIQTTLGGYKFPDGSVQTTAGMATVFHDASLMGNGTSGSPLAIAAISHDTTLAGNGTSGSLLSVAVPLVLSGSFSDPIIFAENKGSGRAVVGRSTSDEGVRGISDSGKGVFGISTSGDGVSGKSADGEGLHGESGGSSGVHGKSATGNGVFGESVKEGNGVTGFGGDGAGSDGGIGVVAVGGTGNNAGHQGGTGVFAKAGVGVNGAAQGLAGKFNGDVEITGSLSKGGGSFKIDHPLDPENKYLYHSFVESPDMMNIYNGNVITDANGDAMVTLPDWFEALNRDFRYQLTVIGTFAQAIVSDEIKGNRFQIKTNAPNVKVSWHVTGIRQDAYANKHRIPVEEIKPEVERGSYLHADAFNQSESSGVEWVRNPQIMRQMKQRRIEAEQRRNQSKTDQR